MSLCCKDCGYKQETQKSITVLSDPSGPANFTEITKDFDENKENKTPEGSQGEVDWLQQYDMEREREEQELQQALAQSLQEQVRNNLLPPVTFPSTGKLMAEENLVFTQQLKRGSCFVFGRTWCSSSTISTDSRFGHSFVCTLGTIPYHRRIGFSKLSVHI